MQDKRHEQLEDYLGRLYGYAFSLCRDPDQAKDLVQDCAVKALAARGVPAARSAYRAWLFKILRNTFIDRNRSHNVRANWLRAEPQVQDAGEYWLTDERLINVITVKTELARLPHDHREIIGLIDFAGLSYAEVAQTLDLPVGTVMSRISRARAALIQAIGDGNVRVLPTAQRRGS